MPFAYQQISQVNKDPSEWWRPLQTESMRYFLTYTIHLFQFENCYGSIRYEYFVSSQMSPQHKSIFFLHEAYVPRRQRPHKAAMEEDARRFLVKTCPH